MYNIEKFIANCIESCINQQDVNSVDYEIIIVNDGSTDNSLVIAEEIVAKSSNARVICRPNGGLSAARNTGLENAKGEYVWFVDGDDAIAPNSISVLLSNIAETYCDTYIINFSTFEFHGIIETSQFQGLDNPTSGEEYHFKYNKVLPMMAWLSVYKRSLLEKNDLRFYVGIVAEDLEFSIRAHHMSSSILFIKSSLYLYRINRKDSIMGILKTNNTNALFSRIKILESFKTFFSNTNNEFTKELYATCAIFFLKDRYSMSYVDNSTNRTLVNNNKWELYGYLWSSHRWKRKILLLLIIFLPEFLLIKLLDKKDGQTSLM